MPSRLLRLAARDLEAHPDEVRTIELEILRTVEAPVEEVFARLVDIDGHNAWMKGSGSMLRRTHQTSPGAPAVGTTFVDETWQGSMPGEIAELEPPRSIVFHWWETSRRGTRTFEGWPGYALEPLEGGRTLVRHHARLEVHGPYALAAPLFRRLAVRERTRTVDALKASFEHPGRPA